MFGNIKTDIKALENKKRAKLSSRFFKTGKGEYGEGDIFLGLTVPQQRQIAKKYQDLLNLAQLEKLLQSKIHEHRLTALVILTHQFQKGKENKKKKIFDLYLRNYKQINSWDLIDLTAPKIIGNHLLDKPKKRKILYQLAKSKNLWKKRIAIMATFEFIRNNQFQDAINISEILLNDNHDLIHKAVGWMLREVGKKNQKIEEKFLKKHYQTMPRTMLRYSIEKFEEEKRQFYLGK